MNEWFEVHRSIALYGIIHSMKEVLQRRCACWRACVRPRRAVQRHFRRVMPILAHPTGWLPPKGPTPPMGPMQEPSPWLFKWSF